MKIIVMAIWSVLVLYFFNNLHLEKSISNHILLFIILFVGVVLIERIAKRHCNR